MPTTNGKETSEGNKTHWLPINPPQGADRALRTRRGGYPEFGSAGGRTAKRKAFRLWHRRRAPARISRPMGREEVTKPRGLQRKSLQPVLATTVAMYPTLRRPTRLSSLKPSPPPNEDTHGPSAGGGACGRGEWTGPASRHLRPPCPSACWLCGKTSEASRGAAALTERGM